jgi:hypothetical protein
MPFVPFCFAFEAGRNDSWTKPRSIDQHFGNGLHHFVCVVAHLPPFAWRSNINSIASCPSLFAEVSKRASNLPDGDLCVETRREYLRSNGVEPSSPDGCPNFVRCESFVRLCRGVPGSRPPIRTRLDWKGCRSFFQNRTVRWITQSIACK